MLTSVCSFPQRGPWGKSSWRGNCSGHIIKAMLEFFRPAIFCDPAEGSGTSRDVAEELRGGGRNIEYYGFDLRSGFNLLKDRLIERLPRAADYIMFHPPYHNMIQYSGNVWGSFPHPDDLSRCKTVEEFLWKLETALYNIYEAVGKGGHYSVLIGDLRKNGDYLSLQSDLIQMAPGKLEGVIIKQQHNCVSERAAYSGEFIPIAHEYLLNFKKDSMVVGFLDCAIQSSMRLVSLSSATWKAVVTAALNRLGGKGSLEEIYKVIAEGAQEKAKANPNWQAKVRQTLQGSALNVERGVWKLAA